MAGGVTVHTIFWEPVARTRSTGSPDTARRSGLRGNAPAVLRRRPGRAAREPRPAATGRHATNPCSVFTTCRSGREARPARPPGSPPGQHDQLRRRRGEHRKPDGPGDSIVDADPYPRSLTSAPRRSSRRSASPTGRCRTEVDKLVDHERTPAGCTTSGTCSCPPDVDECIVPGVCGTNAFGGYHSLSRHTATASRSTPEDRPDHRGRRDRLAGRRPAGQPRRRGPVDIAAHETKEAMTDPEGVG